MALMRMFYIRFIQDKIRRIVINLFTFRLGSYASDESGGQATASQLARLDQALSRLRLSLPASQQLLGSVSVLRKHC